MLLEIKKIKEDKMALSMTGYGKSEGTFGEKKITVELRSLNSKQLDLNIKMPGIYRSLETAIRTELMPLQRGKVDVFVMTENLQARPTSTINEELFKSYYTQLKKLAVELDSTNASFDAILRLPEVIGVERTEVTEEEQATVLNCIKQSLEQLTQFRKQEGKVIMADILDRVNKIEKLLTQVEPFEKERIEATKNRIQQALNDAVGGAQIDKNRFEQEMIYFLEKLDVTEEKTRLRNHCAYFMETSKEDNSGRKLGFIAQEMGREINTLGSKANNSSMQQIVVQMKDELEKIKEQLLNVL